jgi:hypothetical protein
MEDYLYQIICIYLSFTEVDTTLWHHRVGHMSEKGMEILHKINCC